MNFIEQKIKEFNEKLDKQAEARLLEVVAQWHLLGLFGKLDMKETLLLNGFN